MRESFHNACQCSTKKRNSTSMGVSSQTAPHYIVFSALSISLESAQLSSQWHILGLLFLSAVTLPKLLLWEGSINIVSNRVKCTCKPKTSGMSSLLSTWLFTSLEVYSSHLYGLSDSVDLKSNARISPIQSKVWRSRKTHIGRFCRLVED